MTSATKSTADYISSLPDDRKAAMQTLRDTIAKNLPKGFEEMQTSMGLSFVVPHSKYPPGYHCNPQQPLMLASIVSQKNYISLHHLGLYGDAVLLNWFTEEYPKYSKTKLDMGKGCVRFKKMDQIPYELIGELMKKITPEKWIEIYEKAFRR